MQKILAGLCRYEAGNAGTCLQSRKITPGNPFVSSNGTSLTRALYHPGSEHLLSSQ